VATDDEQYLRRAIRARGDMAELGALIHGALAVISIVVLLMGGQPLPFALGALALGATAIWLVRMSRRRRDGRSAPLRALIHEPARVESFTVVDEEAGVQVRITAAGATDYVCPPGKLDDLMAVLQRWCPHAARNGASQRTLASGAPTNRPRV
jgi:hypothetical protein